MSRTARPWGCRSRPVNNPGAPLTRLWAEGAQLGGRLELRPVRQASWRRSRASLARLPPLARETRRLSEYAVGRGSQLTMWGVLRSSPTPMVAAPRLETRQPAAAVRAWSVYIIGTQAPSEAAISRHPAPAMARPAW